MAERSTILIVDDEPFNVDYLEQILEDLGYATLSAANGQQALDQVAAVAPDLILLDVMMPVMDGFAVCQTLKANEDTRLTPIIIMTALDAVEDRIRGIEAGADDFLTNPVNERELLVRIQTRLQLKHTVDRKIGELRQIKDHFAKFVPEAVKRLVAANPDAPELTEKQAQDVSVLFLDISGYTRLSAQLSSEALNSLIERYFSAFLDRIQEAGGDINETAGDGFMAIFQDPDQQRHTRHAVDTALALLAITEALNQETHTQSLAIHLGLNSGLALVGSTRLEGVHGTRWTFTASGSVTNLAARLAGAAEPSQILIGPETAQRLGGDYHVESLAHTHVKDIPETMLFYRVVGRSAKMEGRLWLATNEGEHTLMASFKTHPTSAAVKTSRAKDRQTRVVQHDSPEYYRSLFENALEAMFRSSPDGYFTHVNPAMARLLGYASVEEVLALRLPDDLYAESAQRTRLQTYSFDFPEAGLEGEELVWKKKAGQAVVVSVYCRAMRDRHGQVIAYEGTAQDITSRREVGDALQKAHDELELRVQQRTAELVAANAALQAEISQRQRMEEALRESEERYRMISQSISDYAFCYRRTDDGRTRPEWLTDSFTRVTGYSFEEIRDTSPPPHIHPDDLKRIQSTRNALVPGQPTNYEYRIVTKGGALRWIRSYAWPVADATGRISRVYGAAQDITEHKRVEEALRRSEQLFQSFTDSSLIVAFIKDEEGRYLYANTTFESLLDLKPGEWQGKTDFDLWSAETAKQVHENDRAVLASNTTLEVEEVTQPENGMRWWLSFKFPSQDAEGRRILVASLSEGRQRLRWSSGKIATRRSFRRVASSCSTGIPPPSVWSMVVIPRES